MRKKALITLLMFGFLLCACGNNASESVSDDTVTTEAGVGATTESVSQEVEPNLSNNESLSAYKACKESIISSGKTKEDEFFNGYVYELPMDPNLTEDSKFARYIGTTDDSENIWVINEYVGSKTDLVGMRWNVVLDGDTGSYEIQIPVTFNESSFPVRVIGSFKIEEFSSETPLIPDEVTSDEGMMTAFAQQFENYPSSVIPMSIKQLAWWLDNSENLNVSMQDLGFVSYREDAVENNLGGNSNNNEVQNSDSNKKDTPSTTFTNQYGSPTTKCAHSGCSNYIASSGDTNCCTIHSRKCLDCGKYIDEDAMYCMDCLTNASQKSNNSFSGETNNSKKSGTENSDSNIGAGGYEMPNEGDKSFSDYVKRVDPELYDELFSDDKN